jgi:two-component system KDP operon response regulator KdpE
MTPPPQRFREPARALLVIAQPVLAEVVNLALNHGLYYTRISTTIEDAAAAISQWRPHLIVVDADIIESGAVDRVIAATTEGGGLPVIALTRRGDLRTKLAAFDSGVDDILTIPFSSEEFVARVLALVRRTYHNAAVFSPVLRLGDLEIDILNRRVRAGEADLQLTALERNLLYLLAANAGRVLTRDEILDHLWGADYVAESNVVDRHIHNLRVKLQSHSRTPRYIATVPGRGYRFAPIVSAPPDSSSTR